MSIWICFWFISLVKAQDLKRLQTPLLEEFHNAMNPGIPQGALGDTTNNYKLPNLPTISKPPKRLPSRRLSAISDAMPSPFKSSKRTLNTSRAMQPGTESTQVNESSKKAVTNSRWLVSSRWSYWYCFFFFDVYVFLLWIRLQFFRDTEGVGRRTLWRAWKAPRQVFFFSSSLNIFSKGFEFFFLNIFFVTYIVIK